MSKTKTPTETAPTYSVGQVVRVKDTPYVKAVHLTPGVEAVVLSVGEFRRGVGAGRKGSRSYSVQLDETPTDPRANEDDPSRVWLPESSLEAVRRVRKDGTTTCCGAYSTYCDATVGAGAQVECCKGCYEEVER